MVESDVLKFGDFTLKSGRKSPFFMNAGAYVTALSTGSALLSENYFKSVKYYRPFVLCYNIYNHFKLKNPCICIITNAWITFILASENNKVLL